MTRRLEAGFRRRFRSLLALVRPKRLEFGVELLLGRAREQAAREGRPLAEALALVYLFTRQRVARRLEVTGACTLAEAPWSKLGTTIPRSSATRAWEGWPGGSGPRGTRADRGDARFAGAACARSLRARTRRASAEAAAGSLVLLTSVDDLLDRRLVRDGRSSPFGCPPASSLPTQLRLVLADLGLGLREPRCMSCGGVLQAQAKEAVAERIPPRTARWKDDYWTCLSCGRLFWQGTHWQRIARALEAAAA